MRNLFYQANFCAQCGNKLEQQSVWQRLTQGGYLCAECQKQLHRRPYLLPIFCLFCGAMIAIQFNLRQAIPELNLQSQQTQLPTVSAQETLLQLKPPSAIANIEYEFCGARTKKGTPCKHRVPKGQRCAQHQGRPSMLPDITSDTKASN